MSGSRNALSNIQKPQFYNGLFFAIIFLLFTVLIVNHVWEYRYDIATVEQRGEKEADEMAERIRTSMIQLAEEAPTGGNVLDKYVDSLNRISGMWVRVIQSESINAQYGPEPEENEHPQNQNEREALADGMPRRWTAEGRTVRALPIKAEARCVTCHHLPGSATTSIPAGYVLGLVEVRMPVVPTPEERRSLLEHAILAVGLMLIIAIMFILAIYRLMGMLRLEITACIQNEEALRRANENLTAAMANLEKTKALLLRQEKLASIGILSAGVAHEILNPLNIIGTTAQLLMMDEPKGPIHEKMQSILGQIQRAVKIVKNLGMFASKNRMEVEDVPLPSCFDQAAGSMEHDLKAGNIIIERYFDPATPPIKGDAIQLEQVFAILISNARDAIGSRGNGTITVATRPAEHGIEFKFCDDGPGIPAGIIEKVFDPFFTTKDPGKGTGLGLSIAHRIIEDHGGTLSVESEAGKGACFTIFLPKDGGSAAATTTRNSLW